jgi:hypothetical protein
MKKIDPETFNLPKRLNILENKKGEVFITINRKSRIIMKDGIKISEQILKIKNKKPRASFYLKTSAPVCSKTKTYLNERKIIILDY